jgi:glycerophosphoryl diester phosphodiesterase
MRKIFYTFLLSGFTISAMAEKTSTSNLSNWNAAQNIPLDKFIIQSHRGAGVLAPENTLEAFELGWKMGTYPESDLRTTKDGVIVAFHDEDFSRVVKGVTEDLKKKGVKDLTFAELSKLDVGVWKNTNDFVPRHVSKMTEVFATMRGKPERHLYLDIKNVDLKELAKEVKANKVTRQVILASPKPEIIREWKALVPESDTLLWMSGDEKTRRARIEVLKKENFEGITQIQIHVRPGKDPSAAFPYTPSPKFLLELGPELRSRNILFQTLPYTEDMSVIGKLLDLGVMSFATDYPDVLKREIKKYYDKKSVK